MELSVSDSGCAGVAGEPPDVPVCHALRRAAQRLHERTAPPSAHRRSHNCQYSTAATPTQAQHGVVSVIGHEDWYNEILHVFNI